MIDSWSNLAKRAYIRVKKHWRDILLLYLLNSAVGGFVSLLVFLVIAYPQGLYIVAVVAAAVILIVLSLWIDLAIYVVLISDQKQGVLATIRQVKPLLPGFVWFSTLYTLFIIGLLPLGFLSLGVVIILWSIWSGFSVFVYLDQRKKGLDNLWISRAMARPHFWNIAGKLTLVVGPLVIVGILTTLVANEVLQFLLQMLISLLVSPFIISFAYEIYQCLPVTHEVKKPKVWLILSGLGWVAIVLFIIFMLQETSFPPCIDTTTTRCLTS